MNNPIRQFKYALLICVALCFSSPAAAQEQLAPLTLLDIQDSYIRGEIELDEAVLEQFKVLFEPSNERQIHKCATPALMFYKEHEQELAPITKEKVAALKQEAMASSLVEQSYISPSGKFEIFYHTSGSDSVSVVDEDGNGIPDYVDWAAESADSTYRHEVGNIGFTDPIPAGTRYNIYIINTGGAYGYTEQSSSGGPLTEIFIENDFEGFPPNTHPEGNVKGALYVTIAHEFKHAIQYQQNNWRSPSGAFNWAEMDATLMEEVVYDDVNDYYNYIKNDLNGSTPYFESIFYGPENGTPGAYWHVSWMIFFTEHFGNQIWKDAWQLIEDQNNLPLDEALTEVIPDYGEDFPTVFVRNHLWHFASGSRASLDSYGFEEKADYPYSNMEEELSMVPSQSLAVGDIKPLAARYYEIVPSSGDKGYVDVAVDFDSSQVGIGLLFYYEDGSVEEVISTGANKSQVYIPTEIYWEDISRLGIVIANFSNSTSSRELSLLMGKTGNAIPIRDPEFADLPKEIRVYQNYPNPFNPVTNIDFELPRVAEVKLEVYDLMGRKVQTLADGTFRLGAYSIPFDASGLASGTYLYRLQIDDMSFTKKMLLVK